MSMPTSCAIADGCICMMLSRYLNTRRCLIKTAASPELYELKLKLDECPPVSRIDSRTVVPSGKPQFSLNMEVHPAYSGLAAVLIEHLRVFKYRESIIQIQPSGIAQDVGIDMFTKVPVQLDAFVVMEKVALIARKGGLLDDWRPLPVFEGETAIDGPHIMMKKHVEAGDDMFLSHNANILDENLTLDEITHLAVAKAPSQLYDPRVAELVSLLEFTTHFPGAPYDTPEALGGLLSVGLKNAVTHQVLLESARMVEHLVADDPQEAKLRGHLLLRYLEVDSGKLLGLSQDTTGFDRMFSKMGSYLGIEDQQKQMEDRDRVLRQLQNVAWCPVLSAPPVEGLPWPGTVTHVAPPRVVRPQEGGKALRGDVWFGQGDMWLVSSCMRILDGECRSTALAEALGWEGRPTGSVLAAQLLALRAVLAEGVLSCSAGVERRAQELGKLHRHVSSTALAQQLAAVVPRIYGHLAELVGADEWEVITTILEASCWVWVGAGFTEPASVAFDGPLNLAPYLHVMPSDLACFRDVLTRLGVRQAFSSEDYVGLLTRMHSDCDDGQRALDAQQLPLALWTVQELADLPGCAGTIFVVDSKGLLAKAADLVFNDAPWIGGTTAAHRFVHPKLSHEVSERVGVRSLRRLMLAQNADAMEIGVMASHTAVEAFGQHEALTTRLKHIIDAYADGPGILYELLQNADDAGATEVSLMLDRTQYGTSSVLGPRMADWQGPALVCYNNSVFSAADLQAISRIGQDSKVEKPATIGRFGLGFNAVYHFTDLPSFVSGEHLVYFDPHASHLPGSSAAQPGLKIKVAADLLHHFPDQFTPFLHFGCSMATPYDGTLFRFPLRSP
eukprot:gene5339-6482_t